MLRAAAASFPDRVAGAVRVAAHFGHSAAGNVRYRGADQVGLDVQPGHVGAGRDDRIQRGVRAAAPGLFTGDSHQATLLQPGQHLRHRHLGHPGVLTDLGPGEHLAVEQQAERGPVVQLAQQARRTRPAPRSGLSPCIPEVRLHRGPFLHPLAQCAATNPSSAFAVQVSSATEDFGLYPATEAIL